MIHPHRTSRQQMLLFAASACILLVLACIPVHAETSGTGTAVRPENLKISNTDTGTGTMRTADTATATTTQAPDLLWKFAVFWDYQFYGKTAIPAVDGGYLIAGESRMNGTEDSAQGAAIVLREPENGTTTWKWAWLYGTDGSYDSFSDAAADGTSGYVFAGSSKVFNPPGTDGWFLHTDSGGYGDSSAYWQRTFPGTDSQYADQFNAVARTADGGFAAAGTTGSYHPATSTSDAWLTRMDSTGTTTGTLAYDGTTTKTAAKIRQTTDGGFILAGSDTPAGNAGTRLMLVRLNADNSVRWQKDFGSNPENGAYDIRQTSDGGFIASGYTVDANGHRSIYLVRTDGDGNALWEAMPASGRTTAEGRGVVQADDGGFLVAGSSGGALVVKVDSTGTTEWETVYLPQYPDSTVASLERTADGGFLIGGTRVQADEENPGFQIIKLGPEKTVQQPIALPGMTNAPTDPDNDGLYEDLSGNGEAGFNDVVLFFKQIDWIAENEPVSAFDFSGSGGIGFQDIVSLFKEL